MTGRLPLIGILLLLFFAVTGNAQKPYNKTEKFLKANGIWVSQDSLALNFNDRANFHFKTAIPVGGRSDEGFASIADPLSGSLLFYSNGINCWNKNHVVMPNGSQLKGNSGFSTTQGVCIVPFVNEPGKYYLFSLGAIKHLEDREPTQLYYSVVDMNLNNGLGDIDPARKNILLDSALLSESMIAIPGNNCDVWLVTHARDSAIFKSYHITSEGINTKPLLSYTGSAIQGTTKSSFMGTTYVLLQQAYLIGSMKVAPDRSKLAITCTNLAYSGNYAIPNYPTDVSVGTLLCDFNATTGLVSNSMLIDTFGGYDLAFSPDNSKLYIRSGYHRYQPFGIFQFDLSIMDSAAIVNSKTKIATLNSVFGYSNLRLYNDTIYVKDGDLSFDRINSPNLAGTACNYQVNALTFPNGAYLSTSLPSEVVLAFEPDTVYTKIDTTICSGWAESVLLDLSPSFPDYTFEWNDKSTEGSLEITEAGRYWVRYDNGCHYRVDTFVIQGADLNPVITVDEFKLGTTKPYSTYQWLFNDNLIPEATQQTYDVQANGFYRVIVNDGICTDTSAAYEVKNVDIADIRKAALIKAYPNPAYDQLHIQSPMPVQVSISNMEGKVLLQQSNTTVIDISVLPAGLYLLSFTDRNNNFIQMVKLTKLR